jgi:hypothetical protein
MANQNRSQAHPRSGIRQSRWIAKRRWDMRESLSIVGSAPGEPPETGAKDSGAHERLRLPSTCIVQIRKSIAPSIDTPRGHTTSGARVKEVASPAREQNSSAPIAFRKPGSLRKSRCPIAEAATRAATATNPRMRGAIMFLSTDRLGSRHAMKWHYQNWPKMVPSAVLFTASASAAKHPLRPGFFKTRRCIKSTSRIHQNQP